MAATTIESEKGNSSKISTEGAQIWSVKRDQPVKKNKIKRRNDVLKSAVNAFNKLVDSNPTKELVEYFKEENEKSREQEKVLMQMQCDMQLQMM